MPPRNKTEWTPVPHLPPQDGYEPTMEGKPASRLRSCPFDEGARLTVIRTPRYPGESRLAVDFYAYHVHCTSCAADGPWQKSQASAEQYWNGLVGTRRNRARWA